MMLGVDTVGVRGCVQDGATPIHVAAQEDHKECIEVLARSGADVSKATTVSVEGAAQSVVVARDGVYPCMLSWVLMSMM